MPAKPAKGVKGAKGAKGAKGKGGKGEKKEGDADGVSVDSLQDKIKELTAELDHERVERNYFQLERDKINTFWEITKKELDDRKAELRNKDREAEELEERHHVEIKVYKQKVKHLLYEHQNNVCELQLKFEKKMKLLRDELELRRKVEILEIQERKNAHINELMRKHEKTFGEIKNYYNDITHNNLDLIRSLKEEVSDMNKKLAGNEKLMFEIAQENKKLSEPLTRALKEVEKLRHELANYQKDKMSLQNAKSRLHVLETQLRDLTYVQQKSGFKNILLEKKLEAQAETLEKKEAQLSEVLTASNLDPTMLGAVTKKLDDVLDGKNSALKSLQYELDRVTKAHNDVIRVYESKLTEFGIPLEELGFRPLITNTSTGPAGLVAS
ncbi:growth-arrest-specific micro-tubule binding-domain-containing protein [Pavlovales sp. CCMP2436]|nr:growth-arrest-specific micro-tubule binding-domain-containing protein [Pavlovales sp. CCMP2436]